MKPSLFPKKIKKRKKRTEEEEAFRSGIRTRSKNKEFFGNDLPSSEMICHQGRSSITIVRGNFFARSNEGEAKLRASKNATCFNNGVFETATTINILSKRDHRLRRIILRKPRL